MKQQATRRPLQSSQRQAGYTLVELMMALALFTVAILGIVSMQKVTAVTNGHAKNLAIAQRISQSWSAQLVLDSTTWQNGLAGASWLGNEGSGWVRPGFVGAQNFGAAFDALDDLGFGDGSFVAGEIAKDLRA